MAASVTTSEMYAMDSSMVMLGIELLPGFYGHLIISMACRINCLFLTSDGNTMPVQNNGLAGLGFFSQQPVKL